MRVKIKTWEQMQQEFGGDDDCIYMPRVSFNSEMESRMPADRFIDVSDETDEDGDRTWEFAPGDYFWISHEMIDSITTNDQLEVGRYYFCKSKSSGRISIERCDDISSGEKYIGSRIWASDTNSQALERYDIIGPIEMPKEWK